MRIRLLAIVATVLALLGPTVPGSVSALSCIPLAHVVPKMDVIVRGRIAAMPSNGILELSVSRYYKGGSGGAQVRAEVLGLGQGQRMDWQSLPKVGDELIIGFVRRGDALVNEACHLFVQLEAGQEPPQEVTNYLGAGVLPVGDGQTEPDRASQSTGSARERENQSRQALLWGSLGGLVLIGLSSWLVWRRRRRIA